MREMIRERRRALKRDVQFVGAMIKSPVKTGGVAPSGRRLARAMAAAASADRPGMIVELGPGTGPVTAALLASGMAPERLVLVEFNPEFCRLLRQRFPGVRVIEGDAYAIKKTLEGVVDGPVASVVSSLPLMTRPRAVRRALVEDCADLMGPGGKFVQFTYSRGSPVRDLPASYEVHGGRRVWLNVWPARVWTYARRADA